MFWFDTAEQCVQTCLGIQMELGDSRRMDKEQNVKIKLIVDGPPTDIISEEMRLWVMNSEVGTVQSADPEDSMNRGPGPS